jgi:hypothetical protein
MAIIRVKGIKRDEQNEVTPQIKGMDFGKLHQNPIDLYRKYYKGTSEEYNKLLEENRVSYKDFEKITQNQTIFSAELNDFVVRLHNAVKNSGKTIPDIQDRPARYMNKNNALLESMEFDLSDLTKEQFDIASDYFLANYDSPSMLAFIHIIINERKIITFTSTRGLFYDVDESKLYTSVKSQGKGAVKYGLSTHVDSLETQNWVMLEQARLIAESVKSVLPEENIAFEGYTKGKYYYESEVFGEDPTQKEIEFKEAIESEKAKVKKEEPRGSLSPNTSESYIEESQADAMPINKEEAMQTPEETIQETENIILSSNDDEYEQAIKDIEEKFSARSKSNVDAYIKIKQNQLEEAQTNLPRALELFDEALMNGTEFKKAFDIINQKFRSNPFLENMLAESVRGRILGLQEKDRIIHVLKEMVQNEKMNMEQAMELITKRDGEIANHIQKYGKLESQYKKDLDEFESRYKKLLEEISSYKNENILLSELSNTQKQEIEDTKNKNGELVKEIEAKAGDIKVLESTVSKTKNELNKAESLRDELKDKYSTSEKARVESENKVTALSSQLGILENTIKAKEELLTTALSRNELLQQSNDDLKAKLEEMKNLNKVYADEKTSLLSQLESTKKLLSEAQKAQKQSKENERIEAGVEKNKLRAFYTAPIDKKDIKEKLNKAKDGSLETSRLNLLVNGKVDIQKLKSTPDLGREGLKIIERAENDYLSLKDAGLVEEKENGVFTHKDDLAKSIIYHKSNEDVEALKEEYEAVQYKSTSSESSYYGKKNGNSTKRSR